MKRRNVAMGWGWLLACGAMPAAAGQGTWRVSSDSAGGQASASTESVSISEDGRFVAFASAATNLVPGDTNSNWDVFVHDRLTATTTLRSVDLTGSGSDRSTFDCVLSADGRFVAFPSDASNLVPSDTNGVMDAFVHGPYLTLEASPDLAPPGTTVSFVTWTGLPSGFALLAAVDLNGSPTFLKVLRESFGPTGQWTVTGTVPSSLAGNVITFATWGITPVGTWEVTNAEAVAF